MKIAVLAAFLCILLPFAVRADDAAYKATSFRLQDVTGTAISLEDFTGKIILLNFWATWCPPCRSEVPSMVKLNAAMAGKPFQMLAVSIDEGGKEAVEDFFKRSGATLPVLLDTQQKISKIYGTTGVPETFVLDKHGIVLKKIVGAMDWNDPQVIDYLNTAMSGN